MHIAHTPLLLPTEFCARPTFFQWKIKPVINITKLFSIYSFESWAERSKIIIHQIANKSASAFNGTIYAINSCLWFISWNLRLQFNRIILHRKTVEFYDEHWTACSSHLLALIFDTRGTRAGYFVLELCRSRAPCRTFSPSLARCGCARWIFR